MEGRGVMLVTAVGPHSQQGRIFQLMIQRENEAGFFTKCFRKMRDRLLERKKEEDEESGEEEEGLKKDHIPLLRSSYVNLVRCMHVYL